MSRYFLYDGFKWFKNVDNFDLNLMSENSSTRYILEVDLEHPDELHALHNEYLLAPEKFAIPQDMLSDYCKNIADEYEVKKKKKIPNLYDKTNYLLLYRYLRLCLSLEMKLTKIHKVLNLNRLIG